MEGVSLSVARAGRARGAERTGFASLPVLVQVGVGLVAAAGLAATVTGLADLPLDRWPVLLGLLCFCLLSGAAKVEVPLNQGGSALSWAYVANVLSVILVGPWPSVPLAVAAAWGGSVYRSRDARSWYRTVFTLGSTALSVLSAGLVYQECMGLLPPEYWADLVCATAAATAYFMVTTGLVGLVMAASTEGPTRAAIEARLLTSAPTYYAGAVLAALLGELFTGGRYWWTLAFVVPAYLAYRSYRAHTDRLAAEHVQVVVCQNADTGMGASLAAGVAASRDARGWLIVLADMPAIQLSTLQPWIDKGAQSHGRDQPRSSSRHFAQPLRHDSLGQVVSFNLLLQNKFGHQGGHAIMAADDPFDQSLMSQVAQSGGPAVPKPGHMIDR